MGQIKLDPKEIELWKVVDVKGFVARIVCYNMGLSSIKRAIKSKNAGEAKSEIEDILEQHDWLLGCYNKIDVKLLDENFPINIISKLKEDYLVKLNKDFHELEDLINDYESESISNKQIYEKIQGCNLTLNEIGKLSEEFCCNKRYQEFRNLKLDRRYKYNQ